MALNFNIAPYYDDFDPNKNFHRILFKPGAAVQARELTQSQTILQDQISKFASSIFSQNTPISGGKITTNLNCNYIKLNYTEGTVAVTAENFKNKIISDSTGTILAKVIATAESTGTELGTGDYPTLIVSYLSGTHFADGESIYTTDGSNFSASTISSGSGGNASVVSISEGVFYVVKGYNISNIPNEDGSFSKYSIGNFVNNIQQTTILDKYSNTPSYRVGLQIEESIIDYVDDSSLLDQAVGASNYQAPGADRYKVALTLTALPLDYGNDDGFIELMVIENGQIRKQTDNTVYSAIDDYFAKRTYDTNGDFVINDFNLTPTSNTISSDLYDLRIGKGVAYIRGYKVENQSDLIVTNDRARSYLTQNNNPVYVDYGSYYYVDNVNGKFDVSTATPVDLHVVPANQINSTNTVTYNSTLAGKAYIRGLSYVSDSSSSNTKTYVYKAYLYNITANTISGSVSSAVASALPNSSTLTFVDSSSLSSTNNAYNGVALTIDSGPGAGYSGTIQSYNSTTKTVVLDKTFSTGIPTSDSKFTLRFSSSDVDTIANTTSGTTTVVSRANINASSKVNGVSTNPSILENPNVPELIYNIGYPYISNINSGNYETTQVFRNQSFSAGSLIIKLSNLSGALTSSVIGFSGGTGTLSADAVKQNFIVINNSTGEILDFATSGNTVTISSDKNQVTFSSGTYTSLTATVIAKVNAINSDSSVFLKTKTLVNANDTLVSNTGPSGIVSGNTYIDLTNAQVYIKNGVLGGVGQPVSLYVSDVKRIVKIIDTQSPNDEPSLSMLSDSSYDVTSHFSFDNGQKDSLYDHAAIILEPGRPKPKGNLLVLFDFYSHGGGDGYFSFMSYLNEAYAEIPSFVATNGKTYSLRDSLDFRPSRKNATSNFDFNYTSSPSNNYSGVYLPQDLSNWYSNYSFYLGRKDKLVLSKDKNFQIIKGTASVNPTFPAEPDGSLVIANLSHEPYTAYIPSEAPAGTLPNMSLERIQHKRWTMSDISDLQTRVNNIEYYTSLNLLEQKSQTLQVTDVNGLNRFKNGILVDSFTSYATADTANPDFSVAIDRVNNKMSATHTVTNYPLQSVIAMQTLNKPSASANSLGFQINTIGKTTNYFTLPYTSSTIISQRLASNTVNLNPFTSPIYSGVCQLNPPMDNWVDNEKQPDLLLIDPNLQIYQQSDTLNVLSAGNWQTIAGSQQTFTGPTTFTEGHNINWSPFGFVGFSSSSRTTITTEVQQKTTISGYWKNLGNSYSSTNGFITDISIQPYIRAQQLVFRGKSLKVNTPVSTWFDGVNVDNYISNPDIIELTGVTGTFNEDDVIGIYDYEFNKFKPVAVVVSTYKYPNNNNVRLYIVSNFHSNYYVDPEYNFGILTNAKFDSNGNYVTYTASGTIRDATVVSYHRAGKVSAVGGTYIDNSPSPATLKYYYTVPWSSSAPFVSKYAIWGSPNGTGTLPAGTFNFTVPKAGTHQLRIIVDDNLSGYIKVDGTTYWSSGGGYSPQFWNISLSAGTHTLGLYGASDAQNDGDSFFAVTVSSVLSTSSSESYLPPDSSVLIHTRNLTVGSTIPANVGSVVNMPGGGQYFVGATKISLSGLAINTGNTNYQGAKVTVSSAYVSNNLYGSGTQISRTIQTVTITSYDKATATATLSAPVNVSMGFNIGYGDITSTYSVDGTYNNYLVAITNGGLPKLSTDENGNFVGVFNLPASTFKTGERVFRIDNRTTPGDPGSSTTWAEATFTASGLSTKSQALNFGASISSAKNVFTSTQTRTNVTVNTSTVVNPWDPVAQSFIIDKANYPNGAFLSSAKFFFKNKPMNTNSPVTLSIVGTLNGYPNGETLDNSIVTLNPDKVKISNNPQYLDSSTYTEFTFSSPVYIQPNVLYAFLLQSPSSDYDVYIASQNATALPSSVKNKPTDATPTTITKIGNSPYVGCLFESQNSITWTADQTKALMMVVDRCVFNTSVNPKIAFSVPKGLPSRKMTTQDIETYYTQDIATNIQGIFTNKDVVSDAFNVSSTDFVPTGTGVSYTFKSTLKNSSSYDYERQVTPGKFGTPTFDNIYLDDGLGERVLQANNGSSFLLYATLSSPDNTVSPVISDDGLALYNIQYNINNLGLSNNVISLVSGGTGYNVSTLSVSVSAPDVAGGTNATASAEVANGVISSVYVTYPGSGYLKTPTITISDDTTRSGNSNVSVTLVSEFSPKGGNALARYVTKKVTLSAGNDSQDLRVFFSAYRPINTNIYVFYRIQSRNDSQTFENGSWQLMTYVNNTGNGISQSRNDILEFEAAPGVGGTANGQVTYTSTNGTVFTDFNQFAIKIVMTTPDNTSVPFLNDLRVLALPSYTGI